MGNFWVAGGEFIRRDTLFPNQKVSTATLAKTFLQKSASNSNNER